MIYIYDVNIINVETNKIVYSTTAKGKNQKEAIKNFRNNEKEIRQKYIEVGGFRLGIKRLCKAPFQV
jgi:hypothetical protein